MESIIVDCLRSLTTLMDGEVVLMDQHDTITAALDIIETKITCLQTVGTRPFLIAVGVLGVLMLASLVVGVLNNRKLAKIQQKLGGDRRW